MARRPPTLQPLLALENDICELRHMARLMLRQVEDAFSGDDADAEIKVFLASNVETRASELLRRYYSAIDQAKTAERRQ